MHETSVTDRLLYDPARHEPLLQIPWDEGQARTAIERIVSDVESRYTEDAYWPRHPLDREGKNETAPAATSLYNGACGVFWALHYLHSVGAVSLSGSCVVEFDRLLARNRGELGASAERDRASLMLGDTPIQMMRFDEEPTDQIEDALHNLIAGNVGHPARELLWGSPGTLLAALFLYERTGNRRWSDLFRLTADTLWNQLEWSPSQLCFYWTQDFMGRRWNHLGAMHGFVAAVPPLVRGRHLLDAGRWAAWEECIVNTVSRTADRSGAHANWRPQLDYTTDVTKRLLQFCHGAPGFVICLAGLPSAALDDLLLAAGENIWSAGPLTKGSNLCHGTGGNGYALLKLFQRTRDDRWLERARSFAMHGIAQTQADARRFGQSRYSLWTGDPGFAIYLWDCLRAEAQFPTLDVFHAPRGRVRPFVTSAHRTN